MRKRSTSSRRELEVLSQLLGSSQLPVQQIIAREVGVAQSLVSRARNGKLTRITEKVQRLVDYVHSRIEAEEVAASLAVSTAAENAEQQDVGPAILDADTSKSSLSSSYSKQAIEGVRAYLRDGYDPRLIVEQIAVLRRAQQVRRPGRRSAAQPIDKAFRNALSRPSSTFRLYSGPGPVVRLDSGAGLRLCRRARRRNGWSND